MPVFGLPGVHGHMYLSVSLHPGYGKYRLVWGRNVQGLFFMKFTGILVILAVFLCIPAAGAAEVALSTPQSEYYVLTGEEAIIPLTLVSTYDHDITGTLSQVMIPGNSGGSSSAGKIQSRVFSAFTDSRTASLPVGRSETPADYRLVLTFSYPEDGGRISTLGEIRIHFVTDPDDKNPDENPLISTDSANPQITPTPVSVSQESPEKQTAESKLQNNQLSQDTTALKNQMMQESNQSEKSMSDILDYIMNDPLTTPLMQSLTGAGFTLEKTDISPVSDTSGTFLLTYSSGTMKARIKGVVKETRVQFAEESSGDPIPLPDALLENTTFNEYGTRIADKQFLRKMSSINVTPDMTAVDLVYSNPQNRILHVNAVIENRTVTRLETDNPDDLFPQLVSALALICAIILSAGIWYLARHRPIENVDLGNEPGVPGTIRDLRKSAEQLLNEAEEDARRGIYPEAYRKTGRALRIICSHESGTGHELTNQDVEQLLCSGSGNAKKMMGILDRCRAVGFAKGTPEPGEIREMIRYSRNLLSDSADETKYRDFIGDEQSSTDDILRK